MQRTVSRGWRQHNGESHLRPQDLGVRLDRTNIHYAPGNQLDPAKRLPITTQGELTLRAVGRIVVNLARLLGLKHGLEVENSDQFVNAGHAAMIAKGILLGVQQRRHSRRHSQTAEYPPAGSRVKGIHFGWSPLSEPSSKRREPSPRFDRRF